MGLHEAADELILIAMLHQNRPGFLGGDELHALEIIIGNLRAPIRETLKGIQFGQVDHVFFGRLNVHKGLSSL